MTSTCGRSAWRSLSRAALSSAISHRCSVRIWTHLFARALGRFSAAAVRPVSSSTVQLARCSCPSGLRLLVAQGLWLFPGSSCRAGGNSCAERRASWRPVHGRRCHSPYPRSYFHLLCLIGLDLVYQLPDVVARFLCQVRILTAADFGHRSR